MKKMDMITLDSFLWNSNIITMEVKMFEQKQISEVLEQLNVNRNEGLSGEEAKARLEKNGPNAFQEKKPKQSCRCSCLSLEIQ